MTTGIPLKAAFLIFAALFAARHVTAGAFVLPTLGVSSHADTEVSTNIVLRTIGGGGDKTLDLSLALLGSPSNCLQIAFGCDADGDGVLGSDEAETLFGWRAGRYFVEDMPGGRRVVSEAVAGGGTCGLRVHVEADGDFHPRRIVLTCGGASAFADVVRARPEAFLRREWNLVRVTRRGAGAPPSDWIACNLVTHGLSVFVR